MAHSPGDGRGGEVRGASIPSAAAYRHPGTSVEVARPLLDRGADPNVKLRGAYTSLHRAAAQDSIKRVDLLLDRNGEVNSRTGDGGIPVSLARDNGHDAVAELLRRRDRAE